jgi:hypothetical protein
MILVQIGITAGSLSGDPAVIKEFQISLALLIGENTALIGRFKKVVGRAIPSSGKGEVGVSRTVIPLLSMRKSLV